jgi:hypothetical protein
MAAMIPKERQGGIPPTLSLPSRGKAVDRGRLTQLKGLCRSYLVVAVRCGCCTLLLHCPTYR